MHYYFLFCIYVVVERRGHVFFFFSSRRRHTRCGRDWSSDVCSSDLQVELHQIPRWPRRPGHPPLCAAGCADRKSTRLNSSHVRISYAVFCLKKKKITAERAYDMN